MSAEEIQVEFDLSVGFAPKPHLLPRVFYAHPNRVRAEIRRKNLLAEKAEMEQRAIVRQMTGRMTKPDPETDTPNDLGFFERDEWAGRRRIARLRNLIGMNIATVSTRRYIAAVRRFGYRVARDLAFNTDYFQRRWPPE